MKHRVASLLRYRKKIFSQNGEDGVLEFLLSKIPDKTQWCVEVGAFDGKEASNTYYLISQHAYHGVMIEADPLKYNVLQQNMREFNTICINTFVRPDGDNKLDNVLGQTPIPKIFDLLSIDVDGDDYHIWESLKNYEPKVVIIEINTRDKPGVKRINRLGSASGLGVIKANSSSTLGVVGYTGTSITSMTELAARKKYSLLANVGCNAIFVKSEYLSLFYPGEVTPRDVFTYEGHRITELSFDEMRRLGLKKIIGHLLFH